MNALDDDLRTLFARQADAMPVPVPILDQPVARVTSLDDRRPRRWLLAAAAVALLGAGGIALAQRSGTTPVDPATAPPADPPVAPAAFSYATPTVRLSADSIQVVVGGEAFAPHDVAVHSDPGDGEYTTLELIWTDAGVEQRIFVYFTSDGTQWWAPEISTYGDPGPDRWITTEGQWFTSPLGTPWTGDLDLPNLRITGMTLEAFRRPDVCDHPTGPLAVVSAYPSIDGIVGTGFAGHVQVIDTTTCTVLDPSAYGSRVSVDDPAIALLGGPTPDPAASVTIQGVPADESTGTVPGALVQPLRYDLAFLAVGDTTLRFTVIDAAGAEVGTALVPVTVRSE